MTIQTPPIADRIPHRVTHHGITIEDPYAWLRDPGYPRVEDPRVLGYLQAENAYFEAMMAPHQPLVERLFEELRASQPDAESSVPWRERGWWYQWRFAAGDQYRVWLRARGDDTPPTDDDPAWQVLLDERALAAPHDYFDLGGLAVSPDGRYLAWSADVTGDERYVLRVSDLATGETLPDTLDETHGSPVWFADSRHLAYLVRNAQWRPHQVRVHALGALPDSDRVLYTEPDEGFFLDLAVTSSEDYIVVTSADHVTSQAFRLSAKDPAGVPMAFSPRTTGHEYEVDHGEGRFWFLSNRSHPNFALFSAPEDATDPAEWTPIIPGRDAFYLTWFLRCRGRLVVGEREAGIDQIRVLGDDGEDYRIELPDAAHSVGPGTNSEYDAPMLRLRYHSMVTPVSIIDHAFATRAQVIRKRQVIPSGYDAARFATERLTITARDGTSVPVSIVYRRDLLRDGTAPLYLYGYGAYGEAIMPGFSASRLALLERGFAFAIAHVRGGDDLGYGWYEAGKLGARMNTFNDVVDVARGLIDAGYTRAGRIAIVGGSAGGELVAAAINQAPELWGAAVAHVPFVDVLNTMLDASLPLTPIEWPEWGNPIVDAEAFHYIRSYSPYDQLRAGPYPPMLVTAGLNDPRVTYWEPAKYVARLRSLKTDDRWLLFKTQMGAGHGGQSGRYDALRELAEEYAFLLVSLDG